MSLIFKLDWDINLKVNLDENTYVKPYIGFGVTSVKENSFLLEIQIMEKLKKIVGMRH